MTDVFSDMKITTNTPKAQTMAAKPAQTTSANETSMPVSDSLPASKVNTNKDTVEISKENQPKKKGPVKKLKGFIANIKKFCANTKEYTKGTVKGLATGAVAGSLVYTTGSLINAFKTNMHNKAVAAAKEAAEACGKEFAADSVKKLKKVPNKFLAFATLGIVLAVNLWNASLNATQKRSEIEHRWTGHN